MKIWQGIDWSDLDNQRLLGQHYEWHVIWTNVTQRGQAHVGWENPQHRTVLWQVHEDVVAEMTVRGYHHRTPVPFDPTWLGTVQYPFPMDPQRVDLERWSLVCRWDGQWQGRLGPAEWFEPLRWRYIMQGGCLHDGEVEQLKVGSLCLLCKRYVQVQGLWVPRTDVKELQRVSTAP